MISKKEEKRDEDGTLLFDMTSGSEMHLVMSRLRPHGTSLISEENGQRGFLLWETIATPRDQEDGGGAGGEESNTTSRSLKIVWAPRPSGTSAASGASTSSAPPQGQRSSQPQPNQRSPQQQQVPQSRRQSSSQRDGEAQSRGLEPPIPEPPRPGHRFANSGPGSCMAENLRSRRGADAEVINRALQNENDLLRFQLNDLICREKNQRLELQKLRVHRNVEVSALVQSQTQKMKGEVEKLKRLLEPTSSQLLQALSEKEKAYHERDTATNLMETMKQKIEEKEVSLEDRFRSAEEVLTKSTAMVTNLVGSVDAFQRHVLPTFKPAPHEIAKVRRMSMDPGSPQIILEELQKLETGITLLRVIVDAKNDTLVLIRGKLKQENEELKAELQVARDQSTSIKETVAAMNVPSAAKASIASEEASFEKNLLRQELHSLQDLFNEEVKHLKSKIKVYEQEETVNMSKFAEVQRECQVLQSKITTIDASRQQLEDSLRDETSARSQLVSQLFNMRKDNERVKTELETLKLNQKFLVRQPRSGRLPMEKMDLMNTVNQLLLENNKLKGDKVALEEEVKTQRRSSVIERVKGSVTARDVALCASNKLGDAELANKLARVRLQQLGQGPQTLALTNGSPTLSMTMINPYLLSDTPKGTTQGSPFLDNIPTRDDFSRPRFGQSPKTMSMMNMPSMAGGTGFEQLAGLRERGIIGGSN